MQILRIHINNLNSLRLRTTVSFVDAPLSQADIFAITGDTGAGKTTILDAITLALYGRVARDKDAHKEVMSYGTAECQAEVEFVVKEDRYLASWRMHRARHKLDGNLLAPQRELARWEAEKQAFIAIAEKVRDVDEAVRRITKLDFERFTRSVMLAQGDFAAFLKANDKERSDLLERITGTGIYSELSTGAFERYRQEEQLLKQLQEQQAQLLLLGEEEVDKEQVASAKESTQLQRKELDTALKAVQRLDQWLSTAARVEKLDQELQELNQEQQQFAPQAHRLERSKQVSPFRSEFQNWTHQKEQLPLLVQNAEELSAKLVRTKATYQAKEELEKVAMQSFQETRRAAKIEQNQIQEATTLQEQSRQLQLQWDEQDGKLSELKLELAQLRETIDKHKQTLQDQQGEQDDIKKWLADHKRYADLPKLYQELERDWLQLRKQKEIQDKIQEQLSQQNSTVKKWEIEAAKSASEKEKQDKLLQQLRKSFNELLPERFKSTEEAKIELFGQAIQDLQETRSFLQQLVRLDESYHQTLKEQEEFDEKHTVLREKRQDFRKELLNLLEQRDEYEKTVNYKREIFNQQQLIANYEKDRQNLQQGEPCPLCQATDHPFHDHPVKPFVNEAELELNKAEAKYQEIIGAQRLLMQQEEEMNRQMETLYGESKDSKAQEVLTRALEYEERIALLMETNDTGDWTSERGENLSNRLSELDEQLNLWKDLQKQLLVLNERIEKGSVVFQNTKLSHTENEHQLSLAKSKAATSLTRLQEIQEETLAGEKSLSAKLNAIGEELNMDTAEELLLHLQQMNTAIQQRQERQQSLKQQIEIATNLFSTQSTNFEKVHTQFQKESRKLEVLTKALEKADQDRRALIGDRTVEEAKAHLDERVTKTETALQQAQSSLQAEREALLTQQERMAENEKQQAATNKAIDDIQAQLNNLIQETPFTRLEEALAALLPEEQQAQLEAEQQRIIQALAQTEKSLSDAREERQKLQPEHTDEDAQTQLRKELEEKQTAYEQQLVQLGQLEEKLQQQQEREKRHKDLVKQIEEQRKQFNRWAQLNEIIGQRDGKKFRSFAQGLTLQRLVILANQHLDRLNGRYYIAKKAGTDLELDIIDTFQAENRRSMFTLSGGETFLISLALALGLSDLAGRHAQIQSLFIDEGFGTLDEHSLDMAISTLENLRSGGKTIGIISHVKALKERIGTQIQLHKQSDGFSQVTIRA